MSDPNLAERSAPPALAPPVTTVLVSGGSRGLGIAIVEELLTHGVRVATFARTVTPELAALVAKYEGAALAASVDASDRAAVDAFVKRVESELGPIDGLVNNAAIGQDSLHVHTSQERLEDIIQTNLTAPLV